jgi:hypothetical protein
LLQVSDLVECPLLGQDSLGTEGDGIVHLELVECPFTGQDSLGTESEGLVQLSLFGLELVECPLLGQDSLGTEGDGIVHLELVECPFTGQDSLGTESDGLLQVSDLVECPLLGQDSLGTEGDGIVHLELVECPFAGQDSLLVGTDTDGTPQDFDDFSLQVGFTGRLGAPQLSSHSVVLGSGFFAGHDSPPLGHPTDTDALGAEDHDLLGGLDHSPPFGEALERAAAPIRADIKVIFVILIQLIGTSLKERPKY